jgi:hypothetical protein
VDGDSGEGFGINIESCEAPGKSRSDWCHGGSGIEV